jgi:hypothetical protein
MSEWFDACQRICAAYEEYGAVVLEVASANASRDVATA